MKYPRGNRWRIVVAALGVAMGVILSLVPPPGTPPKPSAAYVTTMNRRLIEVKYADVPLTEVLHHLEQVTGVEIRIDVAALAENDVDPQQLSITARVRNVRVGRALDVILADVAEGKLWHFIDQNGAVVVTTQRSQAQRAITRRYDISDFLGAHPAGRMRDEVGQDILRLITETAARESWVDAGGAIGTASLDDPELVIHHTPEVIWEIDDLMEQLRASRRDLLLLLGEDQP